MNKRRTINITRLRRARRTRMHIRSGACPRLSVFPSNRYLYAQVIDDAAGRTLAQASSKELGVKEKPLLQAEKVGRQIAERAKKAGVSRVVFDKGRYHYHGLVKALAEGARAGGLTF